MSTGVQLKSILKLSRVKKLPEFSMAIELEGIHVSNWVVAYLTSYDNSPGVISHHLRYINNCDISPAAISHQLLISTAVISHEV
jgi:hypothetical protein